MVNGKSEQAVVKFTHLQLAEAQLRDVMRNPAVTGMPDAANAVRRAHRIVARQAGKALAYVKRLEAEEGVAAE